MSTFSKRRNVVPKKQSESNERRRPSTVLKSTETGGASEHDSVQRKPHSKTRKPDNHRKENVEKFTKATLTKGVAGLRMDFAKNKRVYDMEKSLVFQRNQNKNRYKDVACLDATRVVVKGLEPDGYIHASFVSTFRSPKRFICAQAPMDNTCGDFWMMCIQEKVKVIIMLCNFLEKGAKKCSEYFPETVNTSKTFGSITVMKTSEDYFPFSGETQVKIRVSKFTVQDNGAEALHCTHYHWIDWPDRGVPAADMAPIELLDKIYRTTKPIVVHCSAGIGRTGSMVLLQTILELLAEGRQFDEVEKLMLKMREGRANSVQTDHQYLYVHEVLLNYFKALSYLDASVVPYVDKFSAEYVKAVGVPC